MYGSLAAGDEATEILSRNIHDEGNTADEEGDFSMWLPQRRNRWDIVFECELVRSAPVRYLSAAVVTYFVYHTRIDYSAPGQSDPAWTVHSEVAVIR